MSSARSLLRRWLYRIHLALGLLAGAVMLAFGLSGAVLLFRADIERAYRPAVPAPFARDHSIAAVVSSFQSKYPDHKIRSVMLPAPGEAAPVVVVAAGDSGQVRVPFDAASANELPVGSVPQWLTFLVRLHHSLFGPGHQWTGPAGVLLALLCVTGIVVWWPGVRAIAHDAAVSPRRLRALRPRDWHVLTGMWLALPLFVLAVSGTVFTWREAYTRAAQALSGGGTKLNVPPAGETRNLDLDSALAATRRAVPDAEPTLVRMPGKANEALSIRLREPSDWRRLGGTQVFIGADTTVLAVDRLRDKPLAIRSIDMLAGLHLAHVGGWPLKLLWAIVGFAPAVLFLTGVRMAWRKYIRQPAIVAAPERTLISAPAESELERS